jgi:hypothetical protein
MTQKLTTTEAETAAYMAGDLDRAALLGRLDSLQRALGQAVATLESIGEMREAKHARGAAAETLATIGQTFDLWDIEGETV